MKPALLPAVDALLAQSDLSGTLKDLEVTLASVLQGIHGSSAEEINSALGRLSADLLSFHPVPQGCLAMACGALVEHDGDPQISGPALLALLPGFLQGARDFYTRARELAGVEGLSEEEAEDDPPEPSELFEMYFETIQEESPELAWSALGAENVTLSSIAHLGRSKSLRAFARGKPDLLELSNALDNCCEGGRSFLTKMLLVLDDEPLLVLDTDQNKGYRVTISAIPDNFQLHTALMAHLLGDPRQGWIEGIGFDRDAARYALIHTCDESSPILTGAFNLWNWTGLQADGKLTSNVEGNDHWIWNEGTPADIATFDGLRVVVLGPPPYHRTWRGGMIFHGMLPEFVVTEKLALADVQSWLHKLAAASKPTS